MICGMLVKACSEGKTDTGMSEKAEIYSYQTNEVVKTSDLFSKTSDLGLRGA